MGCMPASSLLPAPLRLLKATKVALNITLVIDIRGEGRVGGGCLG